MRALLERNRRAAFGVVVAVFGLAGSGAAAWAGDQGVCVTAHVPEAFTLPDGGMHPAGRLTLCMDRLLNPVVGLHRLSADGDGTALVMSRRAAAGEYTDSRPVLVFRRAPGTALDLVGYVVPFNHKSWKYTLKNPDGIGRFQARAHASAPTDGELVMVIASNGN